MRIATYWAGQSSVRQLAGAVGGLAVAVAGGPVEPAVAAAAAGHTDHTARSWHSTVSSTLPKQLRWHLGPVYRHHLERQ